MEPSGSKLGLALLVLILLPNCLRAEDSVWNVKNPHSLRYELNITSNNQPRCLGQGRMDRMDLLLYDCDNNKVKYVHNMLKGTETLEDMTQKLKEMGDLLRRNLPDIRPENYTKRDSSTLQVGLECQRDANGSCGGSLELGFDGQRFLVFDSENGEYKADNPRGELMKEKCENDEEVTQCFRVFLKGDCKEWLKFLVRRKKELETTAAPATARGTATPPTDSATPATDPGAAPSNRPDTSVIPVILTCLIILSLSSVTVTG